MWSYPKMPKTNESHKLFFTLSFKHSHESHWRQKMHCFYSLYIYTNNSANIFILNEDLSKLKHPTNFQNFDAASNSFSALITESAKLWPMELRQTVSNFLMFYYQCSTFFPPKQPPGVATCRREIVYLTECRMAFHLGTWKRLMKSDWEFRTKWGFCIRGGF